MYFEALLDVVGNRPVWSEKTLPIIYMYWIVTSFFMVSIDYVVIPQGLVGTGVVELLAFVDQRFLNSANVAFFYVCQFW